ncbi:MAG: hypothetical protein H0V89_04865 [Deltaproteobacteria bacterium]|nr:hypothetical protein [Deltaproteobacteria bacterium]
MVLYALAAAGLACNAMMFARVGVVGATVFGSLAAGLHFAEKKATAPAAGMSPERAARAEMPGAGERPVRKVQRLTEELSYYVDRDSVWNGPSRSGNRELTTDDVGDLGPLLVGNV